MAAGQSDRGGTAGRFPAEVVAGVLRGDPARAFASRFVAAGGFFIFCFRIIIILKGRVRRGG